MKKECKYCKTYNRTDSLVFGEFCGALLVDGFELYVDIEKFDDKVYMTIDYDGHNERGSDMVEIKYCPMCGRKLND